MPLFDNRKAKVSLSFVILGGLVLGLLVILGVFVKSAIHKATTDRIKYIYPDGYPANKDLQWCYRRGEGEGKFSDEYYMWNLTNLDEVLAGGNANYVMLGPYVFANWTCDFDWEKDGDFMRYRTSSEGFRFLATQSKGSQYDRITNINPGYLGLLKAAGSEAGIVGLMTGGALKTIITKFQTNDSIQNIQALSRPTVLLNMNAQILPVFAGAFSMNIMTTIFATAFGSEPDPNVKHNAVFNNPAFVAPVPSYGTFQGYAHFINTTYNTMPEPLSNDTMNQLVAAWGYNSDGTGLAAFVQSSPVTIMTSYGVDYNSTKFLLAYAGRYLMNPMSINVGVVQALFYAQWANASRPQINLGGGLKGWELGYVGNVSTPSQLSAATVANLFNASWPYSLTNDTVGAMFWIGVLKGNYTLTDVQTHIDPTLTPTQFMMLRGWVYAYQMNVVPPLLLKKFNLTDWNDFAYAQWGSLVLGKSVGPAQNLPYYPEVAAYDPSPMDKSCVMYTLDETKALLTGSVSLMNPAYTSAFLYLAKNQNYKSTQALFGLDPNKTDCMLAYLEMLSSKAVMPVLNKTLQAGNGMFVTRTVQEWLFTAQDPLLAFLGQNAGVALVGNNTLTVDQARAQDKDFRRIYTGHNDLFTALQDKGYLGPVPHGYWAEDVPIVGFNGSQFMPYDYVKKGSSMKTLQLWHHKVMKPVKLRYFGMTNWKGLDLAYLAIDPGDFSNDTVTPANAKFYATYGGMINESRFVTNRGLPVFLSLPGFQSADPAVKQNLTLVDNIFDPVPDTPFVLSYAKSRHRFQVFLLVEPYLGTALWGNVPMQCNFKYGPTEIFYPYLKPNFAPVYWNAIGDIASQDNIDHLKNTLYKARIIYKALIGIGAGLGGILIILGAIGLFVFRNRYEHANTDDKAQNAKL